MTDFDANVERTNDFLAHYGVPGMKWGKRKAEDSGSSKPSGKDIVNARANVQNDLESAIQKHNAGFDKTTAQFKSAKSDAKSQLKRDQASATNSSEKKLAKIDYKDSVRNAKAQRDAGRQKLAEKLDKEWDARLSQPDVETANRTTTGEKWLLGGAALAIAGSVAVQVLSTSDKFD